VPCGTQLNSTVTSRPPHVKQHSGYHAGAGRQRDAADRAPREAPPLHLTLVTEAKLSPVTGPDVPLTARALACVEQRPDLPHLGVCLSLYLADYPPPGTMPGPAPEARTVRLPMACVCHFQPLLCTPVSSAVL